MAKAKNGHARLIPAVAYLRRSTDKQEASIKQQRAGIEQYAAEHGYRIIRWYTDDAISGDTTEKRLDFQRMRDDAASGDFQAVLCWDLDRFGRFDCLEAGYWVYPFRQAKVNLVTVAEGIVNWDDFTGRVMYSLKQEGKHQFLRDLSRNVTRGQLDAAKGGSWIGTAPYAYRLTGERMNKRLVLGDTTQRKTVRRIFRQFVDEGRSMSSIADKLNHDGIPSPGGRGKPWRFDVVKGILENPAYVGDFVAGRYSYGKYNTIHDGKVAPANGRRRKPEAEWIVRRDYHDAIIDRATFTKAQAILATRKTGCRPHTPEDNPYLLNGKLVCGHCGSALWGEDKRRLSYECSREKYHGDCPGGGCRVREAVVLQCIAEHIRGEFLSLDGGKEAQRAKQSLTWKADRGELKPSDLPKAFAKIKRLVAPPDQPVVNRQRLVNQRKQLATDISKARSNLVLLHPDNIPASQERIRELEQQVEDLDRELAHQHPTEQDINAQATEVMRSLYWLVAAFSYLAEEAAIKKYLETGDDPEGRFEGQWITEFPRGHPPVRRWLNSIDSVIIKTKRVGRENGTRYQFLGGQIRLAPVGLATGRVNPHLPG